MCFLISIIFVFAFGTEIGTENRGFSLVSVPNTEIVGTVTTLVRTWQTLHVFEFFTLFQSFFLKIKIVKEKLFF